MVDGELVVALVSIGGVLACFGVAIAFRIEAAKQDDAPPVVAVPARHCRTPTVTRRRRYPLTMTTIHHQPTQGEAHTWQHRAEDRGPGGNSSFSDSSS